MWLYFLYTLAIGSGHSLTTGDPFRILFEPSRAPSKPETPQGFLIYLDNLGIERIVSFNYAEPVYTVRRITFTNSKANDPHNFKSVDLEYNKTREAHFRAWSLHQYQVLKREIEFLRGEGKEPSNSMLSKYLALEKIALTSDFSTIAELPAIKRIQAEHFDIWKHAIYTDKEEIKANLELPNVYLKSPITKLEDSEMTQPNAQNGIYEDKTLNYKINKAAESLHKCTEAENLKKIVAEFKKYFESGNENENSSFATAKETTGNQNSKIKNKAAEGIKTQDPIKNSNAKIASFDICPDSGQNLACSSDKNNKKQSLSLTGTDELLSSREEQLKIVVNANKLNVHSEIEKLIFGAPAVYVPQQVVDTDEVKRARAEHLKIVNEAILKAKLAQSLKRTGGSKSSLSKTTTN